MSRCKYCREEISWTFQNLFSRRCWVPVDAESLTEEDAELVARNDDLEFRPDDHISHLDTCTHQTKR